MPIFAAKGFRAASTVDIAKAAGISQAYVFRLFPTKADLFVAVFEAASGRMLRFFRKAADNRSDDQTALESMGMAYNELLQSDRDVLMIQLQAQAVSGEPAIAASMRRMFADLHALVSERTDADEEEIRGWFAQGMLINVMAAIGAIDVDEPWAKTLTKREDC